MSRSYLNNEKGKWRMFCDVCHDHDARTYPEAPDLGIFFEEGWFIGTKVDACPECVKAGKLTHDEPHRLYRPKPKGDIRYLLDLGLTIEEIAKRAARTPLAITKELEKDEDENEQ